jgi:hypothetical protein
MRLFFTLFLLFIFHCAFPHTIYIGNRSGAVIKNDMKDLHPGDTLAIRSGKYEKGGSFSNLNHITIINYGGILEFGQSVSLGKLSQVSISGAGSKGLKYGIRFQHIQSNAFTLQGSCDGLSISFCEYINMEGTVLDASKFFVVYTGDTSTLALYKTTISNQKLVHSGALLAGSYASTTSFQNVVDSIAFLNIIIDSTASDVNQVLGSSIYRMMASDWRITGPCPNGKHDAGIFQTHGNGTLRNIYRHGGWGYLWRVWNVGLNGRADSYVYNCIDLSSECYGTLDVRMEAEDTTTDNSIPFCRGASMHVLNNTSGNKRNAIAYVSVLVIAGQFFSQNGYVLEVRNNLSFNTVSDNANKIVKQNTEDALTDTSNNIYVEDPISSGILIDTVDCRLDPSGAAIDKAITIPFIKTDIDGIKRPVGKAADIGAREFPDAGVIGKRHASIPKKYAVIAIGLITVAALILSVKKAAGKGSGNSTVGFNNQASNKG